MPKPACIELPTGEIIPILHEDRSVIAIDKPRNWMLVPFSWQKTDSNLQAALTSSIAARDFWARSRNLRYLRFIHRLDAETTGVLLLGKSPGAVEALSRLFETRAMRKDYLAVIASVPRQRHWTCQLSLGRDPSTIGRMKVDPRHGKDAETDFRVLQTVNNRTLLHAQPRTGRTHQIRVHSASEGHPIIGDKMYGKRTGEAHVDLALRAVGLSYRDPFTRRTIAIRAPMEAFVREYGFDVPVLGS